MQREVEVGRVRGDTELLVSLVLDCRTAPEVPAQAAAGVFQFCLESAHPKSPLVVWNTQTWGIRVFHGAPDHWNSAFHPILLIS